MDISDVCGMNLWDIRHQKWSQQLLEIVGGDATELESKLGKVELDGGAQLGHISNYFVSRYRFSKGLSPLVTGPYFRLCDCSIHGG